VIEIMPSAARAREMAEAFVCPMLSNVIATKPSPAAEVESRLFNPMKQNPASRIQISAQVITTTSVDSYMYNIT
jgi:hypothetical protein